MISFLIDWAYQLFLLLLESGTWLLFGFVAAGFLQSVGFATYAQKFLVTPGLRSVLAASAIGIPLPLCSCSVIPVGIALRRKGASPGATASFFISTPQVGVDSFMLTVGLFSIPFAIARVIISFISALVAGVAIDRTVQGHSAVEPSPEECCTKVKSCCADSKDSKEGPRLSLRTWFSAILELMDDLRNYLVVGFLLAAFIAALVPVDSIESWFSSSWGSYLAAVLIGVPTYVCATASTPLAAVLLLKGVSAGAVLTFLMVGPATNIATVVALHRELGTLGLTWYLGSIIAVAVTCGLMLDLWMPELVSTISQVHDHHAFTLTDWISSALLLLLLAGSWLQSVLRKRATGSVDAVGSSHPCHSG